MLNGARQVPGARAMAVFKSVGAYVALDGLAIANAARPAAGAAGVVVAGDDPALSSTQVGADSRTTFAGARIPVLEPATAQELKDLVRLAFDLSAESGLIVGLMCTTPQADGAGVVDLLPNRAPAVGPQPGRARHGGDPRGRRGLVAASGDVARGRHPRAADPAPPRGRARRRGRPDRAPTRTGPTGSAS